MSTTPIWKSGQRKREMSKTEMKRAGKSAR
jgi:hypothetical protein